MSDRYRTIVFLTLITLIVLSVGVAPVSALQNGAKARSLYVNLEVLAPVVEGNHISTQVTGGWPLTLRLSGNNDIGIGLPRLRTTEFPVLGDQGFLVFADPDGCHSWVDPISEDQVCQGPDETYVEFTPGDTCIATTYDRNPKINVFAYDPCPNPAPPEGCFRGTNTGLSSIGPPQGPENSGYGLGRSGRLPGLVILSDTGVGVVVDQGFNRPNPVQGRNLAGYIKSVAYELNDATSRTSIIAHMSVPPYLFVPIILADRAVHECPPLPGDAWDEAWVRVDGGEIIKLTPGVNSLESVVAGYVTTIRAFVVNGNAPDILADLNHDGVVDAKDAVKAGFTLLSGEETIHLKQYAQPLEYFGYMADLDGNRCIGGIVLPARAGDLTEVPR